MTQLNYLLIEPGEQTFINKYAKTEHDSPSEAALAWARGWERYNEDGSIYRVRIPYAEAYYAYFVNGEDFVVAKEPDYIMEASATEVFASSVAEDIMMTISSDTTLESVSVSESVEESTEGYGPAFDPKLNQELAVATKSSMEDENDKGLKEENHSISLLAEESLEGYVEEETEKESDVAEETHPENYGPGYTTEASSEMENPETIEESLQ